MRPPPGPTDLVVRYSRDMRCHCVMRLRDDGTPALVATRESEAAAEAFARDYAEWTGLRFWTAPVVPLHPRPADPREVAW